MDSRVSAIVIHFGKLAFTDHLVQLLLALESSPEVIVVDNAADEVFQDGKYTGVRVLRLQENLGYGHACNRGAEAASGDFLFILNNDLDFPADPLPTLISAMAAHPRAGAVGPALRFPDGRFQLSYGEHPTLRSEWRERQRQQQSQGDGGALLDARAREASASIEPHWITGACMLIRRKAWQSVAGFDEAYFFYFEDVDICTRLRRAGWNILYQPESMVVHFGGGSDPLKNPRIVLSYRREQLRYYARYNSRLSFVLLQRYLLWKFTRLEAAAAIDSALATELRELIRSFPFHKERQALIMKEKQ
ncbi:MAG: glycosyltransferase family 2 protein [Bacteroidota bacterium]